MCRDEERKMTKSTLPLRRHREPKRKNDEVRGRQGRIGGKLAIKMLPYSVEGAKLDLL
mgnify:FL=1